MNQQKIGQYFFILASVIAILDGALTLDESMQSLKFAILIVAGAVVGLLRHENQKEFKTKISELRLQAESETSVFRKQSSGERRPSIQEWIADYPQWFCRYILFAIPKYYQPCPEIPRSDHRRTL